MKAHEVLELAAVSLDKFEVLTWGHSHHAVDISDELAAIMRQAKYIYECGGQSPLAWQQAARALSIAETIAGEKAE